MILGAHREKGRQRRGSGEAADRLRQVEQREEADDVRRAAAERAQKSLHQHRPDEIDRRKGDRRLAEVEVDRARHQPRMGVGKGGDGDDRERDQRRHAQVDRVEPDERQDDAEAGGSGGDRIEGHQLVVHQPQRGQQAGRPEILFRQHDAHQRAAERELDQVAARHPPRLEHRVQAVVLDQESRADQHDRQRQHAAEPGCRPPDDAALHEEDAEQPDPDREQREADHVVDVERADLDPLRQRQHVDETDGDERETELEGEQALDIAVIDEQRRESARQRQPGLHHADAQDQRRHPFRAGQALEHVEDRQGHEAARRDARKTARNQLDAVTDVEQLHEIGGQQRDHRRADEALDAEMLPRLEQQYAHADVGHAVGDGDPARFDRRQAHMPLQDGEIREQQAVLEAADEAKKHADREIGLAAAERMVGGRRRTGDERLLMRFQHIVAGLLSVSHGEPAVRHGTGDRVGSSERLPC